MVAPNPRREIRDIPDAAGGLILELTVNGLRVATARATADMIDDLRTQRGLTRDEVRADLAKQLNSLPLTPEIDGQVFGYWFGPGEAISAAAVGWPTGALLPRQGQDLSANEVMCLDLVPVHNYWLVLSEIGRYTYRHTSGLLNGEAWRFVPVREVVGTWPVVFEVAFASPLSPAEIAAAYGFEASTRARIDAPAVQLRLRRRP